MSVLSIKLKILNIIIVKTKEVYGLDVLDTELLRFFSVPPKEEIGDIAFSCFYIAKQVSKAPNELASEFILSLKEDIKNLGFVKEFKSFGPYINFYLDSTYLLNKILQDKYIYPDYTNKTIVLDYSSPNIAKPIAVHHIRSTVIGQSIYNIYNFLGWKCISDNYLGDWGTQFGKLIVAFKKWGSKKSLEAKGIKHLLEIYIKFHKEETQELLDDARLLFKKTEMGDKEALSYWKIFKDISIKEFERIYKRLNVKFTNIEGESFYAGKILEDLILDIDKKIGVKKSEGALIVDLEKYDMPPLLLKKQDGSTLYATRDLAAVVDRMNRFKFDELLYVVASQQDLHFKQVIKTVELMGYHWAKNLKHISFGLLTLPGGKMSTREGKIVFLEDVLNEAKTRVLTLINQKNPDLENKDQVAEKVGVGAVIFSDISRKRKQNIVFDWDSVLSFEGETAPYVQYTYARAKGILEKNNFTMKLVNLDGYKSSHYEFLLSKKLLEFTEVLEEAIVTYEPFVIARYVLEIAQLFNKYYYEEKISEIKETKIKQIKLNFIFTTTTYIKELLSILGIDVLEKM